MTKTRLVRTVDISTSAGIIRLSTDVLWAEWLLRGIKSSVDFVAGFLVEVGDCDLYCRGLAHYDTVDFVKTLFIILRWT